MANFGEALLYTVLTQAANAALGRMFPPVAVPTRDTRLESYEALLQKLEQLPTGAIPSARAVAAAAIQSPTHAVERAVAQELAPPVESVQEAKELFRSGNKADRSISTSCVACAQAHLATVSGLLKEAIRFARTGGVVDQEVVVRLNTCLEEIGALERHDWSPENLSASPQKDQEIVRQFQERVRVLRQHLTQVGTKEQLEGVASEAAMISVDFGMAVLRSRGANVDQVLAVAQKVKDGTIGKDEAKAELAAALRPTSTE